MSNEVSQTVPNGVPGTISGLIVQSEPSIQSQVVFIPQDGSAKVVAIAATPLFELAQFAHSKNAEVFAVIDTTGQDPIMTSITIISFL